MEFIDSTALSTALPTLAKAFDADPVHLKLALTSYILALAIFIPISGWAAERFEPRRVFLTAMGVFLLGSALCGFSSNLGELVGARIVQGIGGAMMTPVARLIVVGSAPREDLIRAMGWFTMPALVGPLVGPPLAGFVLSVADWPWIFFINLPIGLLGMIAVIRLVPRIPAVDPGPFDIGGFLLSAAAITGIVVVAETAGLSLLPLPLAAGVVLAALACGWAYVRLARRTPRPILNLDLLRYPTFRASLLGGTLVRLGIGASPFLMPLLLQVGLGWSPLQAGWVTLAGGLGVFVARPFAAPLLKRWGFRLVLLLFVTLTALLTAAPGFFNADTPVWLIMALLAGAGFARSSQFIAANTIAYADVPQDQIAQASTLSAVTQQIGLAMGVSFGGLMLHLARGSGGQLTADRFTLPYIAVGATTLLAVLVYWRLDKDAGAAISGSKRA
ncbi:MFS transporter [Caulobacter mirabilis]|uniref:MFS transporter n=2 Tax=Caulobacter mirabilis TaxID=69666 RepID=A0A2D2B3U0_9CAUL|nr:MFS transporter [Caulobacter mirabilis]